MHKNASFLIILFGIILAVIFVWTGLEPTKIPDDLLIVLSTDGPLTPGSKQEFIVYTLRTNFSSWQKSEFIARLEIKDRKNQSRIIAQANSETKNPLKFLCEIPKTLSAKNITFNLYQKYNYTKPVFSQTLEVHKDISIIAIPPVDQVYCGRWLSTRVFCFSRRNLNGIYRVPIRVKMIAPFKQTTLNRIIHTDVNGSAWFSTFISKRAPAGSYRLEFSHGQESLSLKIPISAGQRSHKAQLTGFASGLNHFTSIALEDQQKEKFSIYAKKTDAFITNLKLGNQQFNFNFDCQNSALRCLEVWQNGKLLNHDFLPIEQGRSAHPLPRSTNPDEPLRLKLWIIRGNKLTFETAALQSYKPDKGSGISSILLLQKRLNISEERLFSLLTAKQMPLYAKNLDVQTDHARLSAITIAPDKAFETDVAGKEQTSGSLRLLVQDHTISAANRFFLVESELNLAKYNFSSLKIHLDAEEFYRNLLSSTSNAYSGMMSILAELEVRIARFNLLPLQDQKAEIEVLEGLLIPVAEYIKFPDLQKDKSQAVLDRIKRILQQLKRFIYLPDELQLMVSNISEAKIFIGPVPEVFEVLTNKEILNSALQPGGKILLENQNNSFSANLTRNLLSFKNTDSSGKRKKLKKLVNLRTDPIVVELIFND
jgi:hypothetical protein